MAIRLPSSWVLVSTPDGSTAVLDNPTSVTPAFVVDRPGTYVAQLTVNDGTAPSAPDTVTITTANSAPVANAGPDQSTLVNQTVTLDGSGSTDVDGDPLTYVWSLVSVPAGSSATLERSHGGRAGIRRRPRRHVRRAAHRLRAERGERTGYGDDHDAQLGAGRQRGPRSDAGRGTGRVPRWRGFIRCGWRSADVPVVVHERAAGSAAVLVNPTSAGPSFIVDRHRDVRGPVDRQRRHASAARPTP